MTITGKKCHNSASWTYDNMRSQGERPWLEKKFDSQAEHREAKTGRNPQGKVVTVPEACRKIVVTDVAIYLRPRSISASRKT